MKAYARLIEYVEHAYEARADLRCQPYPLRLAAGERTGRARKRKVIEPYVHEKAQTRIELLDDLRSYDRFGSRQIERCNEIPCREDIHIGNVRSAIYPYLLARKTNGTFILRIEDTDKSRFVEGATELIIDTLKWLGLEWDEGPEIGGENGPYYQSEQKDIYQ